jgi:hypothetical protein
VSSESKEACRAAGSTAVPLLVERLKRGTSPAARSYARLWARSPLFLPRWLPHPEDQLRVALRQIKAIQLLTHLGREAHGAIPALIEVVQQGDVFSRSSAATAIGDLGQPTPEAVQALKRALLSNQLPLRCRAAAALWKLNPEDEDAFSQVKQLLLYKERYDGSQSPREFNSHRILMPGLIGDMGPKAKKAVPILKQILREEHAGEIYNVVEDALGKIELPTRPGEP